MIWVNFALCYGKSELIYCRLAFHVLVFSSNIFWNDHTTSWQYRNICILSVIVLLKQGHTSLLRTYNLKTHIRDKWACDTETNISSPISDFILLCYIAECGLSGSNGQAHNFKIWMVTSVLPCSLAHWTCFIHVQQNGKCKRIRGISIETLVSVPQTR